MIGVRLLLEYSHFLQIPLAEADANRLIDGWENGHLKGILSSKGFATPGLKWAVRVDKVIGVHTFDLEAQQRAAQQQQGQQGRGIPKEPWQQQ